MQNSNEAARVANRLLVPYDFLIRPGSAVFLFARIFLDAKLLIRVADGKYKKQSMGRAGYKSEEVWIVYAEDIVKSQLARQTELVQQICHDSGIVFLARVSASFSDISNACRRC